MTVLSLPTNRRAVRSVARTHADRALQLVTLLTEGSIVDHKSLAAAALRRVAACRSISRREFELVPAALDVCAAHADPQAPERLVLLLTDVDGWAEAEVGDALGLKLDDVARLRATARARVGAERLARRECRGWGLVGRRRGVTPEETAAADAHRTLCWPCRERLREQQRVRERLQTRSAAVTATVLADVVALTVPAGGATTAGIVGVTASNVVTAVVGAGALAVAVTSAGLAVARVHPAQLVHPAQPQQTRQVQHQPRKQSVPVLPIRKGATSPSSGADTSPTSLMSPVSKQPQLPASLTVPTLVPTALPTVLPTALPTTLPSLLPTALPTAIPTALPTALPTAIPTLPLSLGGTP